MGGGFAVHGILDSSGDEVHIDIRKGMFHLKNRTKITTFPHSIEGVFTIGKSAIDDIHIPLCIDKLRSPDGACSLERKCHLDAILDSHGSCPLCDTDDASIGCTRKVEHSIESIEFEVDIGFSDHTKYFFAKYFGSERDKFDLNRKTLFI